MITIKVSNLKLGANSFVATAHIEGVELKFGGGLHDNMSGKLRPDENLLLPNAAIEVFLIDADSGKRYSDTRTSFFVERNLLRRLLIDRCEDVPVVISSNDDKYIGKDGNLTNRRKARRFRSTQKALDYMTTCIRPGSRVFFLDKVNVTRGLSKVTSRVGLDGFERTAIVLEDIDSNLSFDLVNHDGKLICRINAFDHKDDRYTVDVILNTEEESEPAQRGRFMTIVNGVRCIPVIPENASLFTIAINQQLVEGGSPE